MNKVSLRGCCLVISLLAVNIALPSSKDAQQVVVVDEEEWVTSLSALTIAVPVANDAQQVVVEYDPSLSAQENADRCFDHIRAFKLGIKSRLGNGARWRMTYEDESGVVHYVYEKGIPLMREILTSVKAGLQKQEVFAEIEPAVREFMTPAQREKALRERNFYINAVVKSSPLLKYVLNNTGEVWDESDFDTLMAAGANVDAFDQFGKTQLTALVEEGGKDEYKSAAVLDHQDDERRFAMARKLLDAGATTESSGRYGRTPLIELVVSGRYLGSRQPWVDLLLRHNAFVHAKDLRGYTALDCAVEGGDVSAVKKLEAAGARRSGKSNKAVLEK